MSSLCPVLHSDGLQKKAETISTFAIRPVLSRSRRASHYERELFDCRTSLLLQPLAKQVNFRPLAALGHSPIKF